MSKVLTASSLMAITWLVFPLLFPWNFSLGWLYGGLQGYQFADVIGSEGLSSLTILINGAFLFSFVKFKTTKLPLSATVLALIIFNFAGGQYKKLLPSRSQNLNVVLAQANIGNLESEYQKNPYNYKTKVFDEYAKLTKEGFAKSSQKADLVVWPETAFPEMYSSGFWGSLTGLRLRNFVLKEKVNFLTGIFARSRKGKIANAALFVDPDAKVKTPLVYKKILLAFGEYLPGEKTFPFLRKLLPMVGDFARGEAPQIRTFNSVNTGSAVKAGIQICYEGIFPSFSRELAAKGAQIFINLTNDSWYGPYSEPWQHLYLWAFRAVETRTPMIRATNTGISTVVLADGSFMEQSPLHQTWSGFYKVPLKSSSKATTYVRWGYAIPLPLMFIVFILSLIYGKQRP